MSVYINVSNVVYVVFTSCLYTYVFTTDSSNQIIRRCTKKFSDNGELMDVYHESTYYQYTQCITTCSYIITYDLFQGREVFPPTFQQRYNRQTKHPLTKNNFRIRYENCLSYLDMNNEKRRAILQALDTTMSQPKQLALKLHINLSVILLHEYRFSMVH